MAEALAAVKRELGPDAVILGTRTLSGGRLGGLVGRAQVEITAGLPDLVTPAPRVKTAAPANLTRQAAARQPPATAPGSASAAAADHSQLAGTPVPPPPPLPQELYPYYVRLVQQDVAEELAQQLLRQAAAQPGPGTPSQRVRAALCDYIAKMVPPTGGIAVQPGATRRIALVGPSGAGKSTTTAKLAALFKLRRGRTVALLSLDMHRLDAHVHLQRYAEVLGVPFAAAQTIGEVKQALRTLGTPELLLIDTPGIAIREQARFARLAALLRAVRPDETHLVLPAFLDPRVQERVARSFAPLQVSRVILTRLDEAIGLGVILNTIARLHIAVSYVATGQNVPQDIEEACGARVMELLFADKA